MTTEEEIDIEIAHSILNECFVELARKRAWEVSHGTSLVVQEIDDCIAKIRDVQYGLTTAEARQIIEERSKNGRY